MAVVLAAVSAVYTYVEYQAVVDTTSNVGKRPNLVLPQHNTSTETACQQFNTIPLKKGSVAKQIGDTSER